MSTRKNRTIALFLCGMLLAGMGGCDSVVLKNSKPAPIGPGNAMLTVYTSHQKEIYEPVIKEFEERTGIWVEVETAGTQELLDRIAAEKENPRCDVMFGGGVESLQACKEYFEPYRCPELVNLYSSNFHCEEFYWTGFSALPLVIVYNTKLVSEREAPTTWSSLTDTKWRGRIAFANPWASGSCYTALSTAIQLYGKEGKAFLDAFVRNIDGNLLDFSRDVVPRIADGSFSVGITLESTAQKAVADGIDVAYLYPEDGTSAVPDGTAIVLGAPHPENAKLFLDFTIGADIQAMLASTLERRPVRKGIVQKGNSPSLSSITLIDYDVHWAAENKYLILKIVETTQKELERAKR